MRIIGSFFAVCLLAVTLCACLLLLDIRALVKAQFAYESRAEAQLTTLRTDATDQLAALRIDALAEVDSQAMILQAQLAGTRRDVFAELDEFRGAGMLTAATALAEVDRVRQTAEGQLSMANISLAYGVAAASKTTDHLSSLLDAYAALPDRAVQSPAWLAIEPEITCRHADGTGYGGCLHARVNGLLGEATNAGGVFVREFPAASAAFVGIENSLDRFANKYISPHPQTVKQKIWSGFKVVVGAGAIAARGGLFDVQ